MSSCGLLTVQMEPVPLKSIEVELQVRDHVAAVVSTLNYENKEDKPLEAVFVFPLPGDAAVCHFSAQIGQTQIVAEVKEKQKAREEYDDALSSGQQAFLLEESDESPDIFSLSVGSLPPGESASIRLEYVTELAVQADDGLRFCLPAVLNPRYQPQGSEGAGFQVTSVPASLVPYSLSFSARVSSPRPVSKVESNCSLDPLQYLNTDQTQATVKLAAGHKFDRDVELLIYYKDAHQPTAVVEAGQASAEPGSLMGDPVVMVSLYPEFPQSVMSSVAPCGEFVFLIDRSGSMGSRNHRLTRQTRIHSARDTLLLLLKSLPMGCYFNIYSFGSKYEHIFPKSVEYSQKTVEEALKKVKKMKANLGGTKILEPLKYIYSQPCIPNQPRQLFVFTDGEVGNTKEVIDLVKKNSNSHRCFSFGIGEGASSALINGMAKEGGGHAQFTTGTDRMQPKVMQSLRFALQPAVVDISVTWDLPKEVSVTVLSPPITTLFQGQRSLIYAQLTGQSSEAAEGCVTLKYSLAGHPSENQLHFSLRPAEDTGLTVHMLAARTLIRSLEMEARDDKGEHNEEMKKKVEELSIQSGVSSAFTAFIAVSKSSGEAIQGPLIHIESQGNRLYLREYNFSDSCEISKGTNTGSCGLLTAQKDPVPLKSIEVELEVRDHVATVVSTLNYENKEDKPLEAVFVFPLPGDAAVCHFSAQIGQTQIVAEVKEKQKAREEYDDALSSGQQAFLLEESDESPDIFSLSVGSLPPGESASIRLEYVTELAVQADDGLRFCLPAVLNPRYQPQGSKGAGVQVTSVPASLVPYSLSFSARVSSPRPISKVESNCSLDPLQYLNTDQTQATVKLAAGHKFDRDVELLIYYKDAHQPTAVVEAGQVSAEPGSLMGDPVVMVSLYPEFPQSVMSSMASCGEFVFLMDRSGSMRFRIKRRSLQTCIHSAKDTLLLLLKSLPMGCYFNIYSFGSRYEHIFPKSVEYSQQTMEEALKKVKKMKADLGETEILEPLKHIYSQPCIPNQPRQLFVLTRGWVKNDKEVIDLVKKNSSSHRCFSFGTGENTSYNFINKMSKEGGGHAQFITGTDKIQPKVMQSLQFALQPSVIDISVTWDLPKEVSVTVLSPPITSILQGQRSLIYAQLTGQSSEAAEGCVTLKYSLAGHPSENQLHFSLRPAEDTGFTVHMLAARTLIRSLEMEARDDKGEDDKVKKKVEELSIQSGLSSAFTAFIAVSKSSGEAIQEPLIPPPSLKQCNLVDSCESQPSSSKGISVTEKLRSAFSRINSHFKHAQSCSPQRKGTESQLSVKDPLLQLVSLLEASGCWLLKPALASVLGKTSKEVANLKPASASSEVWATILALIWLHGFKMDAKDEWELLAVKAASWLCAQNATCVTECVEAGNALLGCRVTKDALGL
ncbi:von Willebrand factor A domain-containing protein 5A-like [Pelmatolapia mariae]|uniref:von Willebrand factor A domain-containing protein 5A-like n=1 Tax=Pelmatolapia mariae TaxID=158779 RepID=UPI002FE53ED6